ncbi:MAG: S8 family serine peptidase [Clostridia bacterium]|nr:S8 family serine peptidase [Clostridia bacterium]
MKKIISVLLSIIIIFSFSIFGKSEELTDVEFDNSSVIVTMKHEYSIIDKVYTLEDFNCDKIAYIEDLTPISSESIETSKYDLDAWKKILQLYLIDASNVNVEAVISELSTNEKIETVEKNYVFSMNQKDEIESLQLNTNNQASVASTRSSVAAFISTNDVKFSEQYALGNTSAIKAWGITTGSSNVKVGIIDTGINAHSDFSGNLSTTLSRNFTNEDSLLDTGNHGTKVAGIIGAKANNNFGIAGVCWNVTLVNLKAYEDDAFTLSGGRTKAAWIAEAINYAASIGIDVLNMSGRATDLLGRFSMLNAIDNYDGIIVISSGDDGISNIPYPACYDSNKIICVASIDFFNNLVEDSNYSYTDVDLGAPGKDICTISETNITSIVNGSSYAAPYVTGAIALLLSVNPNLTTSQIRSLITENVDVNSSLLGMVRTGGYLNIFNAILDASGYILGDTNADGTITAADARLALRFSSQLETPSNLQRVLCDMNNDFYITAADSRTILQMAAS